MAWEGHARASVSKQVRLQAPSHRRWQAVRLPSLKRDDATAQQTQLSPGPIADDMAFLEIKAGAAGRRRLQGQDTLWFDPDPIVKQCIARSFRPADFGQETLLGFKEIQDGIAGRQHRSTKRRQAQPATLAPLGAIAGGWRTSFRSPEAGPSGMHIPRHNARPIPVRIRAIRNF